MDNFIKLIEQSVESECTFIGGHYKWPGVPTVSAINSAIFVENLAEQLDGSACIFLDDIGASDACSGSVCAAPSQLRRNENARSILTQDNGEWIRCIQNSLMNNLTNPRTIHELIKDNVPDGIIVNSGSVDSMLLELEQYIYQAHREKFTALLLTNKTNIPHKSILLERSMNNGSSRQLHKIVKKCIPTEMVVERDDGQVYYYSLSKHGFTENKTLLRKETLYNGESSASNFCSALLAQLFFKVLRSRPPKNKNSSSHTIVYVIPCYDRGRLYESIHSFYSIYGPSLHHWFKLENVSIVVSFFYNSTLICDFYHLDGKGVTYYTRGTNGEYLS